MTHQTLSLEKYWKLFSATLKHHNITNSKQGRLEGGLSPEVFFGSQEDGPISGGAYKLEGLKAQVYGIFKCFTPIKL